MFKIYAVLDNKGNYFMSGATDCDKKIQTAYYKEVVGINKIKFITYAKVKEENEAKRIMNLLHSYFERKGIFTNDLGAFHEMMDYVDIIKYKYDNKRFDN